MVQTAEREGLTTRALADRNAQRFKDLAATLDISNDDFIRTTEERHYKSSEEIWRRMAASDNGDIYQSTYSGWYSVRDEAYFDEAELTAGEDGKRYAPSGAEATWVEEPSYFFRLSAYQDRLLKFYDAHPEFIAPRERRNEIVSFVKGGLQDLSISRTTFDWGIPVPGAPGHVMYVWIDALTNYITGAGFPDETSELYRKFWPADLHVIGGHHPLPPVYWPASDERGPGCRPRLRPRLPDLRRARRCRSRSATWSTPSPWSRNSAPIRCAYFLREISWAGWRLGAREFVTQQCRPRQQFRQSRSARWP